MTETAAEDGSVQIIRNAEGEPVFAVLPHAEFEALLIQARRSAGLAAAAEAIRAEINRLALVPSEVVHRIADGEHPVRVWRLQNGLKTVDLAREAGISPGLLSEIESGKKDGQFKTMADIAKALGVKLDDLMPVIDEEQIDEHRREVQLRDIARRISEIDSMINGSSGFDSGAVRDAAQKLIQEADAFMSDRAGKFTWLETVTAKARSIIDEINSTEKSIVRTVTETQGRLAAVFADSLVQAGLFPRDMGQAKSSEAKPGNGASKPRPTLGRPEQAAPAEEAGEAEADDEEDRGDEEHPRGWFLR